MLQVGLLLALVQRAVVLDPAISRLLSDELRNKSCVPSGNGYDVCIFGQRSVPINLTDAVFGEDWLAVGDGRVVHAATLVLQKLSYPHVDGHLAFYCPSQSFSEHPRVVWAGTLQQEQANFQTLLLSRLGTRQ